MDLMDILKKSASNLTEEPGEEKQAFQPMPGGQPPMDPAMAGGAGAPPMDPAMAGGGMPMDPAMAGGAPMDPAMAGGMPPVDPATGMPIDPMTGAPIDPAMMGGAPVEPLVAEMTLSDFKQTIREVISDVLTGGPMEGEGDDAASDKKDTQLGEINEKITMLADVLTGGAASAAADPAAMDAGAPMGGDAAMMGAGAGVPVAPEGMEQQASHNNSKRSVADLIISRVNR